jgi:hypothetical protein
VGDELPVITVIVVDPEVFTVVGLNVAVEPEGRPLALKLMVPVNPVPGATVTVYVVLPPALTVCVAGEADNENGVNTVMLTTGGLGSVTPALSVTVSDAVYWPTVE